MRKLLTLIAFFVALVLVLAACAIDVPWIPNTPPSPVPTPHDPDKYTADEKYIIENTKDFAFTWQCEEGCSDVTVAGGFAPYTATFTAKDMGEHAIAYLWNFQDGTTANGLIVAHRYETPGDKLIRLDILPKTNSHPKGAPLPFTQRLSLQKAPISGEVLWSDERSNSLCQVTLWFKRNPDKPGWYRLHGELVWLKDAYQIQLFPQFSSGVKGEFAGGWQYGIYSTDKSLFKAGSKMELPPFNLEGNGGVVKMIVPEARCFESVDTNPVPLDYGYPDEIVIQVE